ncbi:MAG: hypothetical protein ABI335_17705 [Polyangiaceae bacterium]
MTASLGFAYLAAFSVTNCGGAKFTAADGNSSGGIAGASVIGAAGESAGGRKDGAGGSVSSSRGGGGAADLSGAAGLSGAADSDVGGVGGSYGKGGSASGGSGGVAACLTGWQGSSCDTCSGSPAPPGGQTCAQILACYIASDRAFGCDFAKAAADATVAIVHEVYLCRCP